MAGRTIILLGVVVAVAAAFAVFWFSKAPAEAAWQGYAEADFVKVGPTQQGLVTAFMSSAATASSKARRCSSRTTPPTAPRSSRPSACCSRPRTQLENLKSPGKPTEIAQAEANLARRRRGARQGASRPPAQSALLKTGAATAQIVDQEEADFASANAKIAAAEAALDNRRRRRSADRRRSTAAGSRRSRPPTPRSPRRAGGSTSARVVAPVAGVIADVLARPGETLAAGAPVVSLLPPENIFVRFFVPEPSLAHVHPGDTVALTLRQLSARPRPARVSFISPQAEYTPPFIYSESTRAKFVFLAEARPKPDQAALLNPGQPVTVKPPSRVAMNELVIDVSDLRKSFGDLKVVEGLSLQVAQRRDLRLSRRQRLRQDDDDPHAVRPARSPTAARGPASATTSCARRTTSAARSAT